MAQGSTAYPDDEDLPPLPDWLTEPEKVFGPVEVTGFRPSANFWVTAFATYAAAVGMADQWKKIPR